MIRIIDPETDIQSLASCGTNQVLIPLNSIDESKFDKVTLFDPMHFSNFLKLRNCLNLQKTWSNESVSDAFNTIRQKISRKFSFFARNSPGERVRVAYSRVCLVGRVCIRRSLPKVGLTGQFCFFGVFRTGQWEN